MRCQPLNCQRFPWILLLASLVAMRKLYATQQLNQQGPSIRSLVCSTQIAKPTRLLQFHSAHSAKCRTEQQQPFRAGRGRLLADPMSSFPTCLQLLTAAYQSRRLLQQRLCSMTLHKVMWAGSAQCRPELFQSWWTCSQLAQTMPRCTQPTP